MSQVDDTRLIPLSQGLFAIVDASDYEWLNQWKWYAFKGYKTFYAARKEFRRKTVLMHSMLLPDAPVTDHIDGNGLNNARSNLRSATKSQNAANNTQRPGKTGYRGVYAHHTGKYVARIRHGGVGINIGLFSDKVEAAHAWDAAALKYHGEFARLNFPE